MLNLELNKKQYKSFIDFASQTCDYISLVFEKNGKNHSQYTFQEAYQLILQSIIKKESVTVHPDTGSCFDNVDILFLKLDMPIISFLKQASDMFDWNGKQFPEELCFYRNEKVWFTCVCHERLLHIHNETFADLDFLKINNIKFFYEI